MKEDRITTLFHPIKEMKDPNILRRPQPGEPWRILAIGRMSSYKGTEILCEAVRQLKSEGYKLELSIMGKGDLCTDRSLLAATGAHIVNRWLTTEEILEAYSSHHLVALPYTEASQSGIAADAIAHCTPIVATPVGGLVEQVQNRHVGVLSNSTSSSDFAVALARVIRTPKLYESMQEAMRSAAAEWSYDSFVAAVEHALEQSSTSLDGQPAS